MQIDGLLIDSQAMNPGRGVIGCRPLATMTLYSFYIMLIFI